MTTRDDLRALLLELGAAPFTVKAGRGRRDGLAALTLMLPAETVRRFWEVGKTLKAEMPPGPVVTDPDRSPQHREAGGW